MRENKLCFSIYTTFPFVMSLFSVPRSFISMHLELDTNASIIWKHQVIFLALLMFLGEFLAGVFFVFTNYKEKQITFIKKPNRFNHLNNTISKISGNLCKCSILTYSLIFLAAFLDFISVPGTLLISAFIGEASNTSFAMKVFQIITTGVACYFILRMPLYRHQYLACGLIIIGIGLKTVNQLSTEIQVWYHLILLLLIFTIASIQETLLRWIMDERHISPLHLLCFEGLVGLCICLTVFLILYFIQCPHQSICQIGSPLLDLPNLLSLIFGDWPTVLYLLGYIICSSGLNGFGRYVNYYLTPTHRLISDTLSSVFVWLIPFIISSNKDLGVGLYLNIICYSLLVLGCLIYNEIIVFHFWLLDEFTRRGIMRRSILSSRGEKMELEFQLLKDNEIST